MRHFFFSFFFMDRRFLPSGSGSEYGGPAPYGSFQHRRSVRNVRRLQQRASRLFAFCARCCWVLFFVCFFFVFPVVVCCSFFTHCLPRVLFISCFAKRKTEIGTNWFVSCSVVYGVSEERKSSFAQLWKHSCIFFPRSVETWTGSEQEASKRTHTHAVHTR